MIGVTETVKDKIKKSSAFLGAFVAHLDASLVQPIISLVLKGTCGRGVGWPARGYMNKIF